MASLTEIILGTKGNPDSNVSRLLVGSLIFFSASLAYSLFDKDVVFQSTIAFLLFANALAQIYMWYKNVNIQTPD